MELSCWKFTIMITFVLGTFAFEGIAMGDEKRLIKHLLENYEKVGIVGRPVYNTSETVHVNFGLALIQLLDLNSIDQVITLKAWTRYLWTDILLKWDPTDFGGVSTVRVPISHIWQPDIVLYNSVVEENIYRKSSAMAVVSNGGTVLWIPPTQMKATCSIDMTDFPFDTQACSLKFASWTYDGFKLDLEFYENLESVDITDYIMSNEWRLERYSARKNVKYYPCCAEPYPDLTFNVVFKRIATFYQYTVFLPFGIVTTLLLAIYWLPPGANSKFTIGGIVLFANLLLLLYVGIVYKARLLMANCGLGMIFAVLAMVLSILTANVAKMGDDGLKLPGFLHQIFVRIIGCICCVRQPKAKNIDSKTENPENPSREWIALATVMDRLFFVIHTVLMIIVFSITMPKPQ